MLEKRAKTGEAETVKCPFSSLDTHIREFFLGFAIFTNPCVIINYSPATIIWAIRISV